MNYIKLCPKCGRGYIPDMEHRCDPLDMEADWFERMAHWWFLALTAVGVGLILWMLL